jgi:hypothetical protein
MRFYPWHFKEDFYDLFIFLLIKKSFQVENIIFLFFQNIRIHFKNYHQIDQNISLGKKDPLKEKITI